MPVKNHLGDLAVFGAPPAFEEPLHVGRPNIPDRDRLLTRFNDLLDRRWLTNDGPYLQEFERKPADLTGVSHVVAMCNATLALEMAVQALGWQGEVILPSFTFIATAHALRWRGLTPVFCDADPQTHNLDPRKVEAAITPRTSGIVGVHVWGRPCATEALEGIARRHGLGLIFDAAHALGCTSDGRPIGGFGDAEVFSFHATKVVSTFEGGAVATKSSALAENLGRMRNFGFEGEDRVSQLGTNAKMSEVSAAMGLGGLESMPAWCEVNRRNYLEYRAQLSGLSGLQITPYDAAERNNHQYVVVSVDSDQAGLSRDLVRDVLRAENVLARRYFFPGCHRMEPYRSEMADPAPALPVTEWLTERLLALPTGTAIGGHEIGTIAQVLRLCWQDGEQVRARLAARSTTTSVTEEPSGAAPCRVVTSKSPLRHSNGKRALIAGITGEDGSCLAEHLLGQGQVVHGIEQTWRGARRARSHLTPPCIGRAKAIGFKTKLVDELDPKGFAELLASRRCRILQMRGMSHVKAKGSRINARPLRAATGNWNPNCEENSPPSLRVDPGEFDEFLKRAHRAELEFETFVTTLGLGRLRLEFEDMMRDREAGLRKVISFQRVRPLGLKGRPIINTNDDLRQALANSEAPQTA